MSVIIYFPKIKYASGQDYAKQLDMSFFIQEVSHSFSGPDK